MATPPLTIDLECASAAESRLVGGKAARVALLARFGHRVPRGFCVTLEAFRRAAPGGAQAAIVRRAIAAAYQALGGDAPVAVRSSANLEDLAGASAAGIFETLLNVRGADAVLEAVARCWDSARSERAAAYLGRRRLAVDGVLMGALVQEMVDAEVAGVAFTAHPVTGDPTAVVVSAGLGVGEAVVDGESCDTFVVDRLTGAVREATVQRKAARVVLDPAGGTRRESVPPEEQERPALAGDTLARLAEESSRIADELGQPQDIEWALAGGHLVFLQSRPIVDLPRYFPVSWRGEDRQRRWSLAYRVPFSPFGLSLERLKCSSACAGVREATGQPYRLHQKEVNGFLYVEKEQPPASRWRVLCSAARQLRRGRWFARHWREQVLPRFRGAVAAELARPADPTSVAAQIERYHGVVELLPALYRSAVQVNKLMYFHTRLLARFCHWAAAGDGELTPALLLGAESITTERDRRLLELARKLADCGLEGEADEAAAEAVADVLSATEAGRELLGELHEAAEQWGYIFAGAYPEDPSWSVSLRDVVGYLHRVAGEDDGPSRARAEEADQARRRAYRAVRSALSKRWHSRLLPLGRWVFEWLLRRAREYYPLKEDHNNVFYEATAAARRAALDVGRALVSAGALARAEDVFLLRHEELVRLRQGDAAAPGRLRAAAAERALRLARSRLLTPPEVLVPDAAEPEPVDAREELAGGPGSQGVAEGAARVVHGPADFARVTPGDIVVCCRFRPYWTPLLLVAGGVVIEGGSALSHGANIAREYGVPAVVGVAAATRCVQDGERVRIDGTRGLVHRVKDAQSEGSG